MSKQNEQKERKENYIHSQTSRLEDLDVLQLHHNRKKFLFLNVLLLFAQSKMRYW
jgi:hypothetical protein